MPANTANTPPIPIPTDLGPPHIEIGVNRICSLLDDTSTTAHEPSDGKLITICKQDRRINRKGTADDDDDDGRGGVLQASSRAMGDHLDSRRCPPHPGPRSGCPAPPKPCIDFKVVHLPFFEWGNTTMWSIRSFKAVVAACPPPNPTPAVFGAYHTL
ncbi:hypothetical protein ARMSODRAFT_970069 [Armillaria solidipes]|uniref:Uncharacterized protein n=1 Tax=Armillaria solidipes TaxID=1076256 RepID=A0A2H3CF57_9AGAR|nr:hypothetical protein ARMSODRAFT_970069 [Armillaria solidipes]